MVVCVALDFRGFMKKIRPCLTGLFSFLVLSSVSLNAHAGFWDFLKGPKHAAITRGNSGDPQSALALRPSLPSAQEHIEDVNLLKTLPEGVQKWHRAETILLSRKVDTTRLMSPETNKQNVLFAPEAGNVFRLYGFWIDEKEFKSYASHMPANLDKTFRRVVDGRRPQILFLVHPESYKFYASRFDLASFERETFLATATASSRSLIVWKPGHEQDVFVAKVSLDANIGGVDRTIKGVEAAMSVGTNEILTGAKDLPGNFKFFEENFSAIPKGMDRGAMIIRSIPPQIVSGQQSFIPLFAVYAQPADGSTPLLLTWLKNHPEQTPRDFVRQRLLEPFLRQWVKLAVEEGILMEPHAQNVMIGLDEKGEPQDVFLHRDFGGFNIDMAYRNQIGLSVPGHLPTFTGQVSKDYYQDAHLRNLSTSINSYFDAGFAHNIQGALMNWSSEGKIPSGMSHGEISQMITQILSSELSRYQGQPVEIRNHSYYQDLSLQVPKVRQTYRGSMGTCEWVLR